MKNYTYNFEIMTMVEQFVAAFNDIIVKSYDNEKNLSPNSEVPVRFIYAPKQRVFESLNTPGPGGITLPAVAITTGPIVRDSSRVFNKNEGFFIPYNQPGQSEFLKKIPQPIPIDVTVNMTIMAKYQQHLDQIITNFIPYCDPYIIISWKFPGLTKSDTPFEIRTEVLWNGTITPNLPSELQGNQPFRVSADTSFTIKGWLFKKMDEFSKKIYYIDADFHAISKPSQANLLEILSPYTETISISAKPFIKNSFPYKINFYEDFLNKEDYLNVDLLGKYFFQISNVYLSASNEEMFENVHFFNPFSAIPNLSAANPGFYGLEVPSFNLSNDRFLSFTIPQQPKTDGYIDVIVLNEAGYGKLSQDSFHLDRDLADQLPVAAKGIQINLQSSIYNPPDYLPDYILTQYWRGLLPDWYDLINWYDDLENLSSSVFLPGKPTTVILQESTEPVVNLDDPKWKNPTFINASKLGLTFHSNNLSYVTSNILGSEPYFLPPLVKFTGSAQFGAPK